MADLRLIIWLTTKIKKIIKPLFDYLKRRLSSFILNNLILLSNLLIKFFKYTFFASSSYKTPIYNNFYPILILLEISRKRMKLMREIQKKIVSIA